MKQGFAEHFQNLNPEPAKPEDHGYVKLKDLYYERVRILDRCNEHIWKYNKVEMKV